MQPRMTVRSTELRRVPSSEARANLADLLRDAGDRGERILIERRGKPAVALLSVDDLLRYQLLEAMALPAARAAASRPRAGRRGRAR